MAATTWPEWQAAQALANPYGGVKVTPVPWVLNWQRNPQAPIPPGFVWLACLCLAWPGRPPNWRETVPNHYGHRGGRTVKPAVTVGDICDRCRVPIVQLANRTEPYPLPRVLIVADDGETIPPGAPEVVLDWCRAKGFPVD